MFDEKQYRKEYYLKNKEKILERSSKRWKEKKEAVQEAHKALYKTKNGRIIRFFDSAKKRAKAKNLEFNLDLEFLRSIAPDNCPVFGFPLSWDSWGEQNGLAQEDSPSLDRIDCKKGYTKDNVIWISWKANRLKNDATIEDLLTIYNWMLKTNEQQTTSTASSISEHTL
jgi:hypothetical protein